MNTFNDSGHLGKFADYIQYLQRSELDTQGLRISTDEIRSALATAVDLNRPLPIWFTKINGVSRFWQTSQTPEANLDYFSKDILVGLNGQKIPLYFLIHGEPNMINLYIGTMDEAEGEAVNALFASQYPASQWQEARDTITGIRAFLGQKCQHVGVITGIPTPDVTRKRKEDTQLDRLIRGLNGTEWALLILAEPIEDDTLISGQLALLKEQVRVEQEEGIREWREKRGQAVAMYYSQLLEMQRQFYEFCLYEGGWSIQSYICSPNAATYQRAKALVKAVFSGEVSYVDRIRVLDCPGAGPKVASFSTIFANRSASPSPELTFLETQNKYHTIVSSGQLSALVHLPRREKPGYFVRETTQFDVASHVPESATTIALGQILDQGHSTGNNYRVRVEDFNKHCLLVGITGSGKTNTMFNLLQQLQQTERKIPFLVLEPAKREYRKLARHLQLENKLCIFTVGEESEEAAPFRLNPFEIRPGVSVQTHIDLLKSVFNASFGMWTPLPQILERAIHEVYQDKGWDIVNNRNDRLQFDDESNADWQYQTQPTLTDLYHKVADMVPRLGYDEEVTRNVKTALETRINSLRVGAKGRMLDTLRSIPIEHLVNQPVILELEGVGDDDEKSFIMGLILIALYEYYRTQETPVDDGLSHITVIEEAHRLLANVPASADPEAGNLRGKAVETFVNMLSEIRAYGEGFLIAEQIPTKLAPDVIKNTSLKIVHRMVASDDRKVMGSTMNLNAAQLRQVAILGIGEAVVHGGGLYSDDNAMLIQVPLAKGKSDHSPINLEIRKTWKQFRDEHGLASAFLPYSTCQTYCDGGQNRCVDARKIAENPTVVDAIAAFVHSLILMNDDELNSTENILIPALIRAIMPHLQERDKNPHYIQCILTHAINQFMEKRGADYGWPYKDLVQKKMQLLPMVQAIAQNRSIDRELGQKVAVFCRGYKGLCQQIGPFYGCTMVCGDYCLHRFAVAPLVNKDELQSAFQEATAEDNRANHIDDLADFVVDQVVNSVVPSSSFNQAKMCFIIQQTMAWQAYHWTGKRRLIEEMMTVYNNIGEAHG